MMRRICHQATYALMSSILLGKVGAILIQHLNSINIPRNDQDWDSEMVEIHGNLKELAKEMNCPVIVMTPFDQLHSSSVEHWRGESRPTES